MKRLSIFLIMVALVAAMVGCVPTQYNLTVSNTEGGEVTTPREGTFTYYEGEVVNLVAMTEEGYRFVEWTGDVGTISDINAIATTITMNGEYCITANFAEYTPGEYSPIVAAGTCHTVGVKSDGTVVAVGRNDDGQCDVRGWTDITEVAAGDQHTVGLKSDGTVVAVGAETELPAWNLLEAEP